MWLSAAVAAAGVAGETTLAAFGIVQLVVLGLADALITRRLVGRVGFDFALRPLHELCLFGAWLTACVKREVVWRGNRMRIGPGTTLAPVGVPGEEIAHAHRPA